MQRARGRKGEREREGEGLAFHCPAFTPRFFFFPPCFFPHSPPLVSRSGRSPEIQGHTANVLHGGGVVRLLLSRAEASEGDCVCVCVCAGLRRRKSALVAVHWCAVLRLRKERRQSCGAVCCGLGWRRLEAGEAANCSADERMRRAVAQRHIFLYGGLPHGHGRSRRHFPPVLPLATEFHAALSQAHRHACVLPLCHVAHARAA